MITVDSNAPYTTAFSEETAANAVYLTAKDAVLGECLAVVYRSTPQKLSVLLLGNHGTSGYVDMTLDTSSRYFSACRSLSQAHFGSPVRRALAIAVVRTYSTMDRPLLRFLVEECSGRPFADCAHLYDDVAAGELGSSFKLVYGRLPREIGKRILDAGVTTKKTILSAVVDVAYRDSDETIEQDNELIYSLGSQLEQLFNPLTEYSPEPTEKVYCAPTDSTYTLEDDPEEAQRVCEELYMVQSHLRADLIDFHQNFLVPLRIAVLRGEMDLSMTRLNSIFPPTIDEILRINNLFYLALKEALPFGSFEVLKACGTTLPYFYRALMRHEAATKEFNNLKTLDLPEFQSRLEAFGPGKIDAVMLWSLNLSKIKLLLDRLASREWDEDQRDMVLELYNVAIATVDSFGRALVPQATYNRRTLTPSGKLLSELTLGWPTELEYGWMQNRRVVCIFDGIDVLEETKAQKLHHIIVLFTDTLVILQPQRPIPMTSISGLHIPYVGDMLMHSLLNQVPLDHNLPELKLVAWAPLTNLQFASYNEDRFLQILGSLSRSYELVQSDQSAFRLGEILAKTKIASKMQDLHIFRFASDLVPDVSIYATVHELAHYEKEKMRFPIAVFMNQPVGADVLALYGLQGAISVNVVGTEIVVEVFSVLGYNNEVHVTWETFQAHIINELCYLLTLMLSSQNPTALESITAFNAHTVAKLLAYAQSETEVAVKTHRRHPNMSLPKNVLSPVAEESPLLNGDARGTRMTAPPGSLEGFGRRRPSGGPGGMATSEIVGPRALTTPGGGPAAYGSPGPTASASTAPSARPSSAAPTALRKRDNFEITRDRSHRDLASRPSIASYGMHSEDETAIVYPMHHESSTDFTDAHSDWESLSDDQQNVDEWFDQMDQRDLQSLSSSSGEGFSSQGMHSRSSSKQSAQSSAYQVASFLDESGQSSVYSAIHGDYLHSRTASEASRMSEESGASEASEASGSGYSAYSRLSTSSASTITRNSRYGRVGSQDLSWLAGLVHEGTSPNGSPVRAHGAQESPSRGPTGSAARRLSAMPAGTLSSTQLYPGLRESSIMDLSSFLRTSDTSQSLDLMQLLQANDSESDQGPSEEPSGEPTELQPPILRDLDPDSTPTLDEDRTPRLGNLDFGGLNIS